MTFAQLQYSITYKISVMPKTGILEQKVISSIWNVAQKLAKKGHNKYGRETDLIFRAFCDGVRMCLNLDKCINNVQQCVDAVQKGL